VVQQLIWSCTARQVARLHFLAEQEEADWGDSTHEYVEQVQASHDVHHGPKFDVERVAEYYGFDLFLLYIPG
jgi:hypothetical protein